MHFVSKGLISRESNRSFSLLFDRRHSSDYDDFAYATIEEVDELLPKAKSFISEIESLLLCYADTALVDIPRDYVELDSGEEEVNGRGRDAHAPSGCANEQ